MLLRFGVANHRSIRESQELLLSSSRATGDGLTIPVPVIDGEVVPVAALYGANASGKSNLLDAMDDLRLMVTHSHKRGDATDAIPRSPFRLDAHSSREPTRFECSFTLASATRGSEADDGVVYDLEVEFTEQEIRRECLRRSIQGQRRSTHTLYVRETVDGAVKVDARSHLQGENATIANLTRPNSLFLSAAAQNNHPQLTDVHGWFSEGWTGFIAAGPVPEHAVAERVSDHRHRDWLDRLLKQAEAGVDGVEVGEREVGARELEMARKVADLVVDQVKGDDADPQVLADGLVATASKRLRLLHESAEGLLPLDYGSESRGTRMFLTLILPALDALASGGLLIVDELDSSLHFRLAQAFVSLFLQRESNPHGAQLVFSTHDVALLGSGLLHQDEIWLVDKDADGASALTPMTDFRIRGDFERAYRNGRLGGTPDLLRFFLDLAA